jgi:L-asparaginase II
VVVLGPDGQVRFALGEVTAPMFPRSANKPAQVVGMLRAGLELSWDGRGRSDIALAAASHAGEPEHVRRVLAMLSTAGLTEADLACPPEPPSSAPFSAARRTTMNCSGKHAAMLLTCVTRDWPLTDYTAADHPLQRMITETVAELATERVVATGVDGCGAPVCAISLTALARTFHRLVSAAEGDARRRVADAMRSNPFLVGGTGREDTLLMSGVPGALSKVGAEGVWAVAVPDVGTVAIKIDDGAARARGTVVVAALRSLGLDSPVLDELAEVTLLGGGVPVGSVRALPHLFPV